MLNPEFSRIDEAGAAKLVFQYLNAHFENIQGKLDGQMFKRLEGGETITPDAALQFVLQKHANHKLMQSLESSLKAGNSAQIKVGKSLFGTDAPNSHLKQGA